MKRNKKKPNPPFRQANNRLRKESYYFIMKRLQVILFLLLSFSSGYLSYAGGLPADKAVIVTIFSLSILGALFFWELRHGFMFVGSALYLLIGAVTPEEFVRFASLDVILFLVSMMIVIGMMKDVGLFEWFMMRLLCIKKLTGRKLFLILMLTSALFSSLMGEVASTMVMVMTIISICDFLEVDPLPMVICSVLATNIGSASTVLGNPVGVLIAARSGLSFEDFLIHALPNSTINLAIAAAVLMLIYRHYIRDINLRLLAMSDNQGFIKLISIPTDLKSTVSMVIFAVTIILIGLHKRLELLIGLEENTLLIMFPILSAGVVLLYRYDKARFYIENEIEWPSILFFMFLFAQAGVIQASGAADLLAQAIVDGSGHQLSHLVGFVLFVGGLLSSILDNVVTVATFIPLVQELEALEAANKNLWWALLFGACYGGNITMIGSTANIVALGLLEKRCNIKVVFAQWFKIGALIGVLSLVVSYLVMTSLGYMSPQ